MTDDQVPIELVTITYEIGPDGVTETSRKVEARAWIPRPDSEDERSRADR